MPSTTTATSEAVVLTADQLRDHWQGHRRLTRRMIDAFPDDQLFSYSIGGMRPFSALALECIGMAVPTLNGIISGQWSGGESPAATTKAEILKLWDENTAAIDRLWPSIPPERFQQRELAFGQWDMQMYAMVLYLIDNEIHHRGQGYVYLRSLGVAPPAFYDRS